MDWTGLTNNLMSAVGCYALALPNAIYNQFTVENL